MPRRRKIAERRSEIESWMIAFCLDGTLPSEEIEKENQFKVLSFTQAFSYELACRKGKGPALFEVWAAIKDGDEVKKWRKAHPGKTPYAEQRLRRERKVDNA